jgi:Tol biopolymer transport system component
VAGGRRGLWVAGALLGAAIISGSSASAGSFPGRNGGLVFDAVDQSTRSVQIFRVSSAGSGLTQLTSTTGAVWNEDPTYSANARTIYFDSLDRSTNRPAHVYRMNANGKGRKLVDRASAPTHVWPSVNRSGSGLAVVQYENSGQSVIATMTSNGSNLRVVGGATRRQGAGGPSYAPSGGRIAFYRVTYNNNGQGFASSDVFVRNGNRNTNITGKSSAQYFGASWAPNAGTLVTIRGERSIVSMRPNGTGVRVLTTVSGPPHTYVSSAVYSPDGKKIAYLQCTGNCGDPSLRGQGSVWVMNANGSGKRRVFNGGNGTQPATRLSWGVS